MANRYQDIPPMTVDKHGLAKMLHCSESYIEKHLNPKPGELSRLPPHRKVGRKPIWRVDVALAWISEGPSQTKIQVRSLAEDLMDAHGASK